MTWQGFYPPRLWAQLECWRNQHIVGTDTEAEEVVQEVFLTANATLSRLRRWQLRHGRRPWSFGVS